MIQIKLIDQPAITYRTLRLLLFYLAVAFPPILFVGGVVFANLPLADSMSAYYHQNLDPNLTGQGVMRDWFVGFLFAIGVLLIVYRGYHPFEDWALNIAGILAIGIALFPMEWPRSQDQSLFSIHGACAISFFVCIAYVCIYRAKDTLSLIPDDGLRKYYATIYNFFGSAMILIPLSIWLLISSSPLSESLVFFIESSAVYVFAFYWFFKNKETRSTDLDRMIIRNKVSVQNYSFSDVFRTLPVLLNPAEEAHG
ncbi:hypothetical protein NP603_05660 [Methylomonas sp. SURF-1]|uniref:DUF998 domain-containing protein n=1 Tax=Methylomonas aurea TaxID=2952224 RepID=A0ABT1UEC1_9GAMM|nr:hypothetical protein [Methylomonas sp. SURF-1]MCQ8180584.1 hypothetical protein [Methylomonas sp. SURF-1]